MKNFKKICAVIIAVMVVMSSMSTVFGGLVFADAVTGLSGEGTAGAPYQIGSLAELEWFRDDVNAGNNYSGKYIELTADINLVGEEWTPIGYLGATFKGNFDGGNKTISNLVITKELANTAANNGIGFFGRTDSPAVIKNFTIENVDITGSLYVGAAVGYAYTGELVENITVKGDIAIDAWWYAGVIGGNGYMNLINNCHVIGNDNSYIKGNSGSYIGGIWGFRGEGKNNIANCTVTNLDITGVDRVGGISGIAHYGNTVSDCSANAVTITATDPDATTVGLIVGACQGTADSPSVFKNNTVANTTATVGDKVITSAYGTTIDGSEPVVEKSAAIPSAKVTDISVKELLTSKAPTLTFAKKFVANEVTDEIMAAYGDWYADFVLTVNKKVTFNGDGSADGYLAGQYDEWSENWVLVPFTDVTLEAGQSLKIMEYAAELMGKTGLKITCADVINSVKEFDCGVFFDEEFMAANPDLKVELGLQIFNPENEEETYVIHPEETFVPANAIVYPKIPSATVTDLKAKDLPADTELTFAKKFVADEVTEETAEAYEEWFSDFVLVVNKDVTFNADGSADGYLAGQYQEAYGDTWIKVPFESYTLKANQPVKIMELAAQMLGQPELKITYNDILNFVKEFNCGVYFDEEFKAANPDVTVSLELQVFNPVYESESITIHEAEELDLSDAIIYNPAIGDVNADGKVDAADITLIRQALLGFVEADDTFNVNGDESFDVRDLVKIKKLAADSEKLYAAEELAAALAAGGEVVLTEDVVLPEGFELVVPEGGNCYS